MTAASKVAIVSLSIRDLPDFGRVVIADGPIPEGATITSNPVVVISPGDMAKLKTTPLGDYYFDWTEGRGAVAFGPISIMAHAYVPNAEFRIDEANRCMVVKAIRDIRAGEKVTINYGGHPEARPKLNFAPSGD